MLSQSLGALDIIVNQGQSAFVLIKLTLLALPQLLVMILPIAIFVAALVALNRLHTEQEIVVCFASGMSRWRVISPAMRLAAVVTVVALIVNLWVAPLAERALRDELFRVRTDLAASLVQVGQFTEPAPGPDRLRPEQSTPAGAAQPVRHPGRSRRRRHHLLRRARQGDQAQRRAGAGHARRLEPGVHRHGRPELPEV